MQKLQLSIPEPCHENWQQMTPTDQGRFCNACAKEVVDFSTMTDMQVLNYFSTLTHEKVCGRALPEQLNRAISRPEAPKKRLFWYWNYIVMFLMLFTKGNTTKAQGGIKLVTQCSPVKANDIRGEIATKGGIKREGSRIITGKVTDIDGTPISFASVKIKGTNTGVSSDVNGTYSIKINSNTVLVISAATFKPTEVPIGFQNVLNTFLEPAGGSIVCVVVGGIIGTSMDYASPDKRKAMAILKVKDEETGKYLSEASVIINSNSFIDTVFTNTKGIYKIKGIENYGRYFIQVKAEGYEGNEFTISESDFKDRKKEWEVLLRKQKVEAIKPTAVVTETKIRLEGVRAIVIDQGKGALCVADGIIMPNGADIKPEDVETYSVLQGPEASALFGPGGANGAIVITTRKSKERSLDTLFISTSSLTVGVVKVEESYTRTAMGAMVKGVTIKSKNTITDSLKMFATKLTGALKIYPNPVQRGNTFNIALKLKQTGLYQIQITDATGRVVLQKQINVPGKEFTESIQADSRWSSGAYYISLIDSNNKLINKTSFIFQ
ncbi:MAG: carboxypeptidase-like regulatory domain-containing protein [Ferruginibacter sp.]